MKKNKIYNHKISESKNMDEIRYKEWIPYVKMFVQDAIVNREFDKDDIYSLIDLLKTTYRAGAPEKYYEKMVSEIADWYEKGMK